MKKSLSTMLVAVLVITAPGPLATRAAAQALAGGLRVAPVTMSLNPFGSAAGVNVGAPTNVPVLTGAPALTGFPQVSLQSPVALTAQPIVAQPIIAPVPLAKPIAASGNAAALATFMKPAAARPADAAVLHELFDNQLSAAEVEASALPASPAAAASHLSAIGGASAAKSPAAVSLREDVQRIYPAKDGANGGKAGLAPASRFSTRRFFQQLVIALTLVTAMPGMVMAQHFGQNKTKTNAHETVVLETPHYDVHFDKDAEEAARIYARAGEVGYEHLKKMLKHEFVYKSGPKKGQPYRRPIVYYNNDASFLQTNILGGGVLPEGVMGVTEPYQTRIALPFQPDTGSGVKTDVHEKAHGFQFDIAGKRMGSLPGWFVEGQAEYLSQGKIDASTAMWLREMALAGKLPDIPDIDGFMNYRMGLSVWQFIVEKYGEDKVAEITKQAVGGENGVTAVLKQRAGLPVDLDSAFQRAIGRNLRQLSGEWRRAILRLELPKVAEHYWAAEFAQPLAGPEHDGTPVNFGPAVSPDGKHVSFLSFGRDMMLGIYTGPIEALMNEGQREPYKPTRLIEAERSDSFDSLRLLNASQSWSRSGKQLAFAATSKGGATITIVEVRGKDAEVTVKSLKGKDADTKQVIRVLEKKSVRQLRIPLDDAFNPSWSADDKQLVFTGLHNGFSNLYRINADGTGLQQLTHDRYSDLQPVWSPDGTKIAYATDNRPETDYERLQFGEHRIAVYDLATGEVTYLPNQGEGRNINPQWSPDGKDIAFVSDRSGIENIFIYNLEKGQVSQATDVLSGIVGIADGAPSFTWAQTPGEEDFFVFSAMERGGAALYRMASPRDTAKPYVPSQPRRELPPPNQVPRVDSPTVQRHNTVMLWKPGQVDVPEPEKGRSKAPATPAPASESQTPVILGPDGQPARDAQGNVQEPYVVKPYQPKLKIDFSDSTNMTYGVNSGFYQSAVITMSDVMGNHRLFLMLMGQAQRIQESNFMAGYSNQKGKIDWGVSAFQMGRANIGQSWEGQLGPTSGGGLTYRGVELFAQKPISRFKRVEVGAQAVQVSRQNLSQDAQGNVYALGTSRMHYALPTTAFVYDNTISGPWGPVTGRRARFEVGRAFGTLSFNQSYADMRQYWGNPDFQIALRAVAGTMSGKNSQNFFLGGGHTVRGTPYGTIIGEKMAMFNAEVRFPVIPIMVMQWPLPHLSQVRGALFVDSARTWTEEAAAKILNQVGYYANKPVTTYGVAFTLPLMGSIPFEIARVWRLDKNDPYVQIDKKRYGPSWTFTIKVPF